MYLEPKVAKYAAERAANVASAVALQIGEFGSPAGVQSTIILSAKLSGDSIPAVAPQLSHPERRVDSMV